MAEHLEGRTAPSTLELIAAGRDLADASGGRARIVVLGHDVKELATHLAGYTLDVLQADHPSLAEYTGDAYVQAVRGIVDSMHPRIVLVAHTAQGYDFAPALAGAMDLPFLANCLALRADGDRIVALRRILNEKVQAEVEIRSERPIVVTLRPGATAPASLGRGMMSVTAVPVSIDPGKVRVKFVRLERPQVEDIDLSSADIIVSAGRGIQKKENLALSRSSRRRLEASSARRDLSPTWTGFRRPAKSDRVARRSGRSSTSRAGSAGRCSTWPG